MLTSDLSNASINDLGATSLDQGMIHIQRSLFLGASALHQRLVIRNYAFVRLRVRLDLRFEADFADLFEVRGMHRERRGERLPATLDADSVTLGYRGLDGLVRSTRLAFEPAPQWLAGNTAVFELELEPHGRTTIFVEAACTPSPQPRHRPRAAFLAAFVQSKRTLRAIAARLGGDHLPQRGVRRDGAPVGQRHPHVDHRKADRAVSLCRHPLVQHRVRAGRDHHGAVDAVARPGPGGRRLALPRAGAGDQLRPGVRSRARQDPARGARRGDGRAARGAVPALLRQRRLDPAIRHARRRLSGAHGGRGYPAVALAEHPSGVGLDGPPRGCGRLRRL